MTLSIPEVLSTEQVAIWVERESPGSAAAVQLTGMYHNLLRSWAEM